MMGSMYANLEPENTTEDERVMGWIEPVGGCAMVSMSIWSLGVTYMM